MKTIGLIGGLSWQSTIVYYDTINRLINQKLGGHHCAKILLINVDFHDIVSLQNQDNWSAIVHILSEAAGNLEKGGADFFLICTNTLHAVADEIIKATAIPCIHMVDVVAQHIKTLGFQKVGLIGTRFTMEMPFYHDRLKHSHGIDMLVPDPLARQVVHDTIFNELVFGQFKSDSKDRFVSIIQDLAHHGAQGVILGCTEIPLLVSPSEVSLPLFDSTILHATKAAEEALK